MAGQEPQPRVSSLNPMPLLDGAVPHPDTRRVPNTHITAAGAPPPGSEAEPVRAAKAAPPSVDEAAAPATAAIGEAIQQLLDSQTAVPQEVEEAAHEITARDQVAAMPPADAPDEPAHGEPAVRPLPAAAPIERRQADNTEPMILRVETHAEAVSEPRAELRVEPYATPTPMAAPPSPRWSAPPTPVAAPAAPAPALSDRELAKFSFIEEPTPARAPAAVQALAPEPPDEPHTGLGLLLAAAIVVIGVGGWAITRGGFPMPKRPAVPAAVAPPTPAETAPGAVPPVVDPGLPTTVPTEAAAVPPTTSVPSPELGDVARAAEPSAAAPTPAPKPTATAAAPVAERAPRPSPAPAPAPRPASAARPNEGTEGRPGSEPTPAATTASGAQAGQLASAATGAPTEAAADEDGVLKLTPHAEPLPETPTRENVQSALDALRKEVMQCAVGHRGVAEVDLTVASTGVVTHAIVAGDFAGTMEGSCIARVVRGAKFAPFSKPRFRVIYPFSL